MEHPLRCEAVQEGDRKEYRVTGTGSYLRLPEVCAATDKAAPLKWCPQRDSMGFALPQHWEYLSVGSFKLPNEGIGDG